jgi:adenylyltransferase/sulfurtransferase
MLKFSYYKKDYTVNEYYSRQYMLWGEDTQNILSTKSVAIVGSGGMGCSLGLALSGLGLKEFYMIDFDKIEIHNIHRQIAFSKQDDGLEKAVVLSKIIENRSFSKATPIVHDFEYFTNLSIKPDLILDATDNLATRKQINDFAKKNNIPWIYASVEEFRGQVAFFENASFDEVFKISVLPPKGVIAPMVAQIATLSANLASRYLANLKVKKDILHYMYYKDDGDFCVDKFTLQTN